MTRHKLVGKVPSAFSSDMIPREILVEIVPRCTPISISIAGVLTALYLHVSMLVFDGRPALIDVYPGCMPDLNVVQLLAELG
jgi:hypothetical protein